MEISNDVLFMFAIILLFFCLMKDRPCNVEGLDAPASPNYNAKVTDKQHFNDWLSQQDAKVDYSQCGPTGKGLCTPCSYIGIKRDQGCGGIQNKGQNFNINDNKKNHYTQAGENMCDGGKCGIVCESQFEGGPDESVKYGLPQNQNGLFCKMY